MYLLVTTQKGQGYCRNLFGKVFTTTDASSTGIQSASQCDKAKKNLSSAFIFLNKFQQIELIQS
jgi:hypothetical protein